MRLSVKEWVHLPEACKYEVIKADWATDENGRKHPPQTEWLAPDPIERRAGIEAVV
ncbi:MAG: hypothetical protein ACREML_13450 [Vulcanimicrobiaceae bacterium]